MLVALLSLPCTGIAVASEDRASVVYSYLLDGSNTKGDPLSDLALAHHFRSLVALPRANDTSDQASALLAQLDEAATAMEARTEPLLMADPILLTLRLGPMSRKSDTPEQRAAWAHQLEKIGKDNIYSGLKIMDWAQSAGDAEAFLRGLVLAASGKYYDNYNLAVVQSISRRYADVGRPEMPLVGTNPLQVALDAAPISPLLDLYQNSWACRKNHADLRKICSLIYRRIANEAVDPDTAWLAAVVLETVGDADQQAEARKIRKSTDWIVYSVGKLLMSAEARGMAAHEEDRRAFGLLIAHKRFLIANEVDVEPPLGWESPNRVESLDGPEKVATPKED